MDGYSKFSILLMATLSVTATLASLDVTPQEPNSNPSLDELELLLRAIAEAQIARGALGREPPVIHLVSETMPIQNQKRSFRFVGSRGKKSDSFTKSYLPARGRRSSLT
ncbi:hypothetical protein QR680_017513 [Steinernema hermaphroditum]|uniref:Uncharacterized protein n=1 Tax=Steinernema hermaphroditum TaxID=289476 RepID=A0AA39HGW4_9BILA|nr:hypothetical protein QR680_017513 [Steinernema hermaphroditum]